jgi:thiamine biosynthesis protein ThiS
MSADMVTVLFFAGARDLVLNGSRSVEFPLSSSPTDAGNGYKIQEFVDKELFVAYPSMKPLIESGAWALALNGTVVPVEEWPATGLRNGDTLAVLPPVSGG